MKAGCRAGEEKACWRCAWEFCPPGLARSPAGRLRPRQSPDRRAPGSAPRVPPTGPPGGWALASSLLALPSQFSPPVLFLYLGFFSCRFLWLILLKEANDLAGQLARRRGARCDRDAFFAAQPGGIELRKVLNTHGWHAGQFLRNLNQAICVIAAGIANHDGQVRAFCLSHDRLLTALRRGADIDMHLHVGILPAHILDHAPGVPLRKGGLRGKGQLLLLLWRQLQRIDISLGFDQADVAGHLAQHALRFRVALLADIQDVVAFRYQLAHKVMRDCDIGAGGVDAVQAACARALLDQRRDPVRGEDDRAGLYLLKNARAVGSVERDDAQVGELFDRVTIMHNLPDHVDWSRILWISGGLAHYLQSINDAVTIAPGRDFDDFHCVL